LLGGVSLLVVLGLAAVLLVAQTSWGRERLRAELVQAVNAKLRGHIEIGGFRGVPWGLAEFGPVRVYDEAGALVVSADSLLVDWQPLALLEKMVHLRRVVLARPVVHAWRGGDGELNLGRLIRDDEKDEAGGAGWLRALRVDELMVRGGRLQFEDRGAAARQRFTAGELRILASVDSQLGVRPLARIGLRELSLRWREKGLAVRAEAGLTAASSYLTGNHVTVQVGASELRLAQALLWLPTGTVAAALHARLEPAEWRRLGGSPQLAVAPASLRAAVLRPFQGARFHGLLAASVPAGQVRGLGIADAAGAVAWLKLRDLEPRKLDPRAPAGRVSGPVTLRVRRREGDLPLEGSVATELRGRLAEVQIQALALRAALAAGAGQAALDARTSRGRLQAQAKAQLAGAGRGASLTFAGSALRWGRIAADELRGSARLYGLDRSARGQLALEAQGLRQGSQRIGPARIEASVAEGGRSARARVRAGRPTGLFDLDVTALARRSDAQLRVQVPALRARTFEVIWRGGADVTLATDGRGDVRVDHLALSSRTASLRAHGHLPARGLGQLQVELDSVDLAALRDLMPGNPDLPVKGQFSGRLWAAVQRRGAARRLEAVELSGELRDLTVRDAPPLASAFWLNARDGIARMDARVAGRELGTAHLQVVGKAPGDLLDAAGWRRTSPADLDKVRLELDDLELRRVAELARRYDLELAGRASGVLALTDGGDVLLADVRVAGAQLAPLKGPVDLELYGDGRADAIAMRTALAIDGRTMLRVHGEVGLGLRELWRAPGQLTTRRLRGGFELPRVELARLAALLDVRHPVRGALCGSGQLSGTLRAPQVALEMRLEKPGYQATELSDLQLRASASAGRWQLRLNAPPGSRSQLDLAARGRLAATAPVQGHLRANGFSLATFDGLLRTVNQEMGDLRGQLYARLELAGTVAQPQLRGTIGVRDGGIRAARGIRRIENAEIALRLEPRNFTLDVGFRSGGGTARLSTRGHLVGLLPSTFRGTLRTRQLPVVAGASRIAVDLDGAFTGARRERAWAIDMQARSGTIYLPKRMEKRRFHPTGPLEDVEYRDDAVADARQGAGRETTSWRLSLTTPRGLRVRGDGDLDAWIEADLVVASAGGVTTIDGTVEATRGDATLFDRRYRISRARAAFTGDAPTNPHLNVLLEHSFESAEVSIAVQGTLDEPEVELSSEPAIYSQAELLGFVLGGNPDAPDDREGAGGGWRRSAAGAATALVASQLESIVEKRIPVDTLRLGTDADDPGTLAFVSVGKWLADKLFVAYRRRFDAETNENANEAEIEYHFRRNWMVEGMIGDRGAGSVDLLWVRRF
jgi:autotransporter translocation and assembly factor TamB